MKNEGKHVTRALFERNLSEKRKSRQFSADITPLLASGYTWDKDGAVETVLRMSVDVHSVRKPNACQLHAGMATRLPPSQTTQYKRVSQCQS